VRYRPIFSPESYLRGLPTIDLCPLDQSPLSAHCPFNIGHSNPLGTRHKNGTERPSDSEGNLNIPTFPRTASLTSHQVVCRLHLSDQLYPHPIRHTSNEKHRGSKLAQLGCLRLNRAAFPRLLPSSRLPHRGIYSHGRCSHTARAAQRSIFFLAGSGDGIVASGM
jgi:hypothetical protein